MKRLSLLLACVATAALAVPSEAVAYTYTDPAGDVRGGQAGFDIVSVTYATTGRGSGRGYVPENIVVTMKLAGPVVDTPGATYRLESEVVRCGGYTAFIYPSVEEKAGRIFTECGSAPGESRVRGFAVDTVASGNTITFTAPLARLAGAIRRGDQFRGLESFAGIEDPFVAIWGNGNVQLGNHGPALDTADGFRTWTVG